MLGGSIEKGTLFLPITIIWYREIKHDARSVSETANARGDTNYTNCIRLQYNQVLLGITMRAVVGQYE